MIANPFLLSVTTIVGVLVALSIFNLYNDCKNLYAENDAAVVVCDVVFIIIIITIFMVLMSFIQKK